jgi:hypothetical protein
MSDLSLEVPPYPQEVGDAVADATLESFTSMNDGTPCFIIDGKKYMARKIGPRFPRIFAKKQRQKYSPAAPVSQKCKSKRDRRRDHVQNRSSKQSKGRSI